MARKRMLSPEFFTSGPVAELPISAVVTFAGLWCYFDDYGRGGRPPRPSSKPPSGRAAPR